LSGAQDLASFWVTPVVDATKTLLLAAQQVCPPSSTLTDFLSQFVKTSGLMAGWQTTLPAAFEF
jgi:hypothetical protein